MKKYLLAIIFSFIFVGCALKEQNYTHINVKPYSAIFTTSLDDEEEPTDNIKEITLNEERVYLYVKWNLPIENRTHTIKIYDGDGNNVYTYNYNFTPSSTNWYTWSWYEFKKEQDKAGLWKFQIYSKGKLLIEKYLKVLPAKN